MMDVSEAHGLRPQAQAPTHVAAAQHMSPYAGKFIWINLNLSGAAQFGNRRIASLTTEWGMRA